MSVAQGNGFFTLGASRGKLVLAGTSVLAAVAVLVTQLSSIGGDSSDALAPLRAAAAMPDERAPFEDASDVALAREQELPSGVEASAPPGPSLAGGAEGGAEMWGHLFDRIMERQARQTDTAEHITEEPLAPPPRLDGHALTGIVRNDGGSLALLDGRLYRVGDRLPDSPMTVAAIEVDRVMLSSPDHPDGLFVLLEPLRSRETAATETEP